MPMKFIIFVESSLTSLREFMRKLLKVSKAIAGHGCS